MFSKFRKLALIYRDTFENKSLTPEQEAILVQNEAEVRSHKEQYARVIEMNQRGLQDELARWHIQVQDLKGEDAMMEFDRTFGLLSRIIMDAEQFTDKYHSKVSQQCAELSQHLFARILSCNRELFIGTQLGSLPLFKRQQSFYVAQTDKSVSLGSSSLYLPYIRTLACLACAGSKCSFDFDHEITSGDLVMESQLLVSVAQQVLRTVTKQDSELAVVCFYCLLVVLFPALPSKGVSYLSEALLQHYECKCVLNVLESVTGDIGRVMEDISIPVYSPSLLLQYHRSALVSRYEWLLEVQKKRETSLPYAKPVIDKQYIIRSNIVAHVLPSIMTTCAALLKSTSVSAQTHTWSVHVAVQAILIACSDDVIQTLHCDLFSSKATSNTSFLLKLQSNTQSQSSNVQILYFDRVGSNNVVLEAIGFSANSAAYGVRSLQWVQETRARLDQWLPGQFQVIVAQSNQANVMSISLTAALALRLFAPQFLPETSNAATDLLVGSLSSTIPIVNKKSVGSVKVLVQKQLLQALHSEQRLYAELSRLPQLLQSSLTVDQLRCVHLIQGYAATSCIQKRPMDSLLAQTELVLAMCRSLTVSPLDARMTTTNDSFATPHLLASISPQLFQMYISIGAYSSNPAPLLHCVLSHLSDAVEKWGMVDPQKSASSNKPSSGNDLESQVHVDMSKEKVHTEEDSRSEHYGYFSELVILLAYLLKGISVNVLRQTTVFQPFSFPAVSQDDLAACLIDILHVLLTILQLPCNPQLSASEARSVQENITSANVHPGQVWDEQLYRYTRISQSVSIEVVCHLLAVIPRFYHSKVVPRVITSQLQLCESGVHHITVNAEFGLLYVAKLLGFSDTGVLIRAYADQVVNEIATKITMLHAKRDIERIGNDYDSLDNITLLTVTKQLQQCRQMYDQCRMLFHKLVVKPEITMRNDDGSSSNSKSGAIKSLITIVDDDIDVVQSINGNDIDSTQSDQPESTDDNEETTQLQEQLSQCLSQYKQLKIDCKRVIAQYECVCSSSTSIASVLTTAQSHAYSYIDITSDNPAQSTNASYGEIVDLLPMLRDVLLRSIETLTHCVEDQHKQPLYVQQDEVPTQERINEILENRRDVNKDSLNFAWTSRLHVEHEVELALRCLHAVVAAIGSRSISMLANLDQVFKEEYQRRYRGRTMRERWKQEFLLLSQSTTQSKSHSELESTTTIAASEPKSAALIEQQQLDQHYTALPIEMGLSSIIVNHTSTLASINTDNTCTPILQNNQVYLPKRDSTDKVVGSIRQGLFSRVNVILKEKEERREYKRADSERGKLGIALEWWKQLEKRRQKDEKESMMKKNGQVDDLQDKEEASDFEYDSDFDEDLVQGKRITEREQRELDSLKTGHRNPKRESVFEAKHRLFRQLRSQKEQEGVKLGGDERFGVQVEVVDDAEEIAKREELAADNEKESSPFQFPFCPYLAPGEDPYLDDPLWVSVPVVEASPIGQDGARAPSAEENVLEIVLARLSSLAQWPNSRLQARTAHILQHTFAALGVVGRVWTSLTSSGVGAAMTQREVVRARQKAEREALRRLQGKGGKKRNAFAGMIYGKEEWTLDEPSANQGQIADDDEMALPTTEEQHLLEQQRRYDFYSQGEDASIVPPSTMPARPLPPQHDIRVMPAVTRYWATLKYFMFPKHKSDRSTTSYPSALPAALRLGAVLLSIASVFLATKVQNEVWPLFKHTFARAVVDVLDKPFNVTKHTLAYRVLRSGLEFQLQCSLCPDIARPQAQEILTAILPLTLHPQNDPITAIVRTIIALLSVQDSGSVQHILYSTAMKLGATQNMLTTVLSTVAQNDTMQPCEHRKYVPRNIPANSTPVILAALHATHHNAHLKTWDSVFKAVPYADPASTLKHSVTESSCSLTMISDIPSYIKNSLTELFPQSSPQDITKRTQDIITLTSALNDLKQLRKSTVRSLGYYEGQL